MTADALANQTAPTKGLKAPKYVFLFIGDHETGGLTIGFAGTDHDTYLSLLDSQEEYVAYGTYEPLTVTVTHILNNRSGVSFSSYSHTGLPVAMFAHGVNAEQFNGYYDNTEIYTALCAGIFLAKTHPARQT